MSKIDKIQQTLDQIKAANNVPVEVREKQIINTIQTNNMLIDYRLIKDFAKSKEMTESIYNTLKSHCIEIYILNEDDNIIKIGKSSDFIDNQASIFSAVLNKDVFITKNRLIKFLINKQCIHPAKIEESLILLADLISRAEYSHITTNDILDFLNLSIK